MRSQRIRTSGLLLSVMLLSIPSAHGQNEEDAVRVGTMQVGGTARTMGLAGAFGALGADPGSAWSNPAGMALFRTSELSFTPAIEMNDATARFQNSESAAMDQRFFFGNMALVLNARGKEGSPWHSSSFGIVYDRLATHHWERSATGGGVRSSILQQFAREATGTPFNDLENAFPFGADLAFMTFGIDTAGGVSSYLPAIPDGAATRQTHTISSGGANTNTSFFWAGNYEERLYIGAAIGILGSRLERRIKQVVAPEEQTIDLREFSFEERLVVRGSGFDLKVGVIGRLSDAFRLGMAVHSPAYFTLNDAYTTTMSTRFITPDSEGRTQYRFDSPDGAFSYRQTTPWRVVTSAAVIIAGRGALSVDHEYADMRAMRYRRSNAFADDYDFSAENAAIKSSLRATHNVRIGTEWRFQGTYLRGGWAYWQAPYAVSDRRHADPMMRFSLGGGQRWERISVDLTLAYDKTSDRYTPYAPDLVEPITTDLTNFRAFVTVGLRP